MYLQVLKVHLCSYMPASKNAHDNASLGLERHRLITYLPMYDCVQLLPTLGTGPTNAGHAALRSIIKIGREVEFPDDIENGEQS
jgi:hypothetical protein